MFGKFKIKGRSDVSPKQKPNSKKQVFPFLNLLSGRRLSLGHCATQLQSTISTWRRTVGLMEKSEEMLGSN